MIIPNASRRQLAFLGIVVSVLLVGCGDDVISTETVEIFPDDEIESIEGTWGLTASGTLLYAENLSEPEIVTRIEAPSGSFEQFDSWGRRYCGITSSNQVVCGGLTDRLERRVVLGKDHAYEHVSLGDYGKTACAVTRAGLMDCWKYHEEDETFVAYNRHPMTRKGPPAGENLEQAHVGNDFICMMSASGTVDCWGRYAIEGISSGGVPRPGDGTYEYVDAFAEDVCGITPAGRLDCWGDFGADWEEVQSIDFGASPAGACALKTSGRIECSRTQIDPPAPPSFPWNLLPWTIPETFAEVTVVSSNAGCGLTAAGEVYCWYYRTQGRPNWRD